jgi:hypothetical protein
LAARATSGIVQGVPFVVAIVALIVLLAVAPRVIQFFLDVKGRKVFAGASCSACGAVYDRVAVRRARHLLKTKVSGGPPPEPFSVISYEAWELRCGRCGHVDDFDPAGDVIRFDVDAGGGPVNEAVDGGDGPRSR